MPVLAPAITLSALQPSAYLAALSDGVRARGFADAEFGPNGAGSWWIVLPVGGTHMEIDFFAVPTPFDKTLESQVRVSDLQIGGVLYMEDAAVMAQCAPLIVEALSAVPGLWRAVESAWADASNDLARRGRRADGVCG